jgi:Family of unknown function (DUF6526)
VASNPQTFANHVRYDPLFHFLLLPVALISFILAVVQFVRFPGWGHGWLVVVASAAIVAILRFRIYSLRVQDRIIRLEERLRLQSLLPEPLRPRIPEVAEDQLMALRFASDAELPALVQRCLDEKLSRKDIKKAIVNWRADYLRV